MTQPGGHEPFVLAHLSDPHVPTRLAPRMRDLASKRLFGYLSWTVKRRHVHRASILHALLADLRRNHVVVSGDIVNIALHHEFVAALAWLGQVGTPDHVSVIPGNHDAYVAVPFGRTWSHWASYMRDDGGSAADLGASERHTDPFPYLRRRGPIAIIGLCTAVPTRPGFSSGRLGSAQLAALRAALHRCAGNGVFRTVLLHHPPGLLHQHGRKGLDDATAFRAVIADAGAELILHGHEHRFRSETIEGRHGPVPVIGVPSASAALGHCKEPAQYHLYRVQPVSHGWCLRILRRRLADDTGRFADVGWHTIDLPRPRTSPLVEPSRTPATDGC